MVKPNLVVAALLVGLGACGPAPSPGSAAFPTPALSSAERAQLAHLETRPMKLAVLGADGSCPATSLSTVKPYKDQAITTELYGAGPVYGAGGPETRSAINAYYDVTYLADPTVHGVVLVRIQTIDRLHQGVFVGKYAAGPMVGSDKVGGQRVDMYGELALPVARPSPRAELGPEWNVALAPGWVAWHARQGVDASWKCVAIQIDNDSGTEVVVVAG